MALEELYGSHRRLWMPLDSHWTRPPPGTTPCCHDMASALAFSCAQHDNPFECPDGLIVYNEQVGVYGIPVHDGGWSYVTVSFCPWCGQRLSAVG